MTHLLDLWRGNRNGLQDWNSFQRSMDRFFDEMNRSMVPNEKSSVFTPACDVEENATNYTLSMDIPGLPKEAIKIEVIENTLVVSGQRFEERK